MHKYYDDRFAENTYVAGLTGLTLQELNFMELEFLTTIQFKISVAEQEYSQYQKAIATQIG